MSWTWFRNLVADALVWLGYCPCCKRGLEEDEPRDCVLGRICRPCFEQSAATMNASAPVFTALLRAGVDRDVANAMMTTYLKHGEK